MKRVTLIIPDAGPLISLGKINRLDILLKLLVIYSVSRLHDVQKQINPKNQLKGTIQKGVECV